MIGKEKENFSLCFKSFENMRGEECEQYCMAYLLKNSKFPKITICLRSL